MTARTLPAALTALLVLALTALIPTGITAAPTPMPGGANQIKGVTGTMQSTIFNGKLRFRKFVLRNSTPDEGTPDPGTQMLTLTYIVSDGMPKQAYGNVSGSMADADGILADGRSVGVYGAYYTMPPGGAGFVPVKILLQPGDGPAIRINLKASDVPAMPAPSPTPTK
jgi:hypothetical protein